MHGGGEKVPGSFPNRILAVRIEPGPFSVMRIDAMEMLSLNR
jgi:hypothetical protein